MKVVVAGGTGFIGSALVQALRERGDDVAVLTRNPGSHSMGAGVETLEWHPPALGSWTQAIDGADGVVNLAGAPIQEEIWAPAQRAWNRNGFVAAIPAMARAGAGMLVGAVTSRRRSERDRQAIRQSRLDATRAVVNAIAQAKQRPSVLVNGSAIGYYGPAGDRVLTESSPSGSDFVATVAVDWENEARRVEELGVRLVLVRTGIVLGRDDGALAELAFPFRLFAGGTMGYPDQWVSWIDLQDEVGLIIHALTDPNVHGPLNATAPNPVTMAVFSTQIGQALGRPVWAPLMPLVLKALLGERSDILLASQRVLPEQAEQTGYHFVSTDSGEALRRILGQDEGAG